MPLKPPMLVSMFGVGRSVRMTTVDGSGASSAVTALNLSELASSSSMIRRYENTTSSAVNGVPSWKATPSRRRKVQVSWSGLTSHDSASAGRISRFASGSTSVSNTFSSTSNEK